MSTHQNTHTQIPIPTLSTQLPTTPGNIMARNAFGDAQSSVTTKVEAALLGCCRRLVSGLVSLIYAIER